MQYDELVPIQLHQPSLIEVFLKCLDVSETTKVLYERHLYQFFSYLQEKNIEKPSREDIIQYKEHFKEKKLKPATINTYLVPVFLFFQFTSDTGAYPNITTGIKRVKDTSGNKKSALSAFQTKRLLQYLSKQTGPSAKRDYAMVHLILRTGLRGIEVARCNVGDIGSEAGQTVLYIWGKGRTGKDNFVVLTETIYDILMDYLLTRNNPGEEEPLFTSVSPHNQGKRLTTRSISRIVKNALRACGLNSPKLTSHSLRHTAVTAALLEGASVQSTKEMARHANIETTMIYAHNVNRVGKDAAERKVEQWMEHLLSEE